MGTVYSRLSVEGVIIPGIIHNGSYFFTWLAVYENGMVNCWHRRDLWQFEKELERGWVVPSLPTGQELSIYGLGSFRVREARWAYDQAGYYQHVKETVRSLNPEMANLYRTTQRDLDLQNSRRVDYMMDPTPFKIRNQVGYFREDGKFLSLFHRTAQGLSLTTLTAYEDQSLRLGDEERFYSLAEADELLQEGTLCTGPGGAEWVSIPGLGELLLAPGDYEPVDLQEKRKEVAELVKEAAGEPDAHDKCVDAYHQYLEDPCDWTRDRLREAYEAVPEHQRMFLGDMDTRDSDYRRILYCPGEKREV